MKYIEIYEFFPQMIVHLKSECFQLKKHLTQSRRGLRSQQSTSFEMFSPELNLENGYETGAPRDDDDP